MRLLKTFALLVLLAAVFAGGYAARSVAGKATPHPAERRVLYWVDPMHPAYKSDKPGIAPDCGMALEPVYADEGGTATGTTGQKILYYRDPHQPSYTADAPGLNPETGNTLEAVYDTVTPGVPPPGAIAISAERQQLIGVKFATVERGGATRAIRTVGRIAVDETRVGHVHTRIDGWIEQVFVDFTGDVVKKGEPMLTVYSPEMLASQQELLLAGRARDLMNSNPLASAARHGESLFEAARRRLQLWDLSDDQIEQVLRTGQPLRSITVHAPMSGFITARNAFPNQKVTADSDLYTITDLSRVWIIADVFESDVASVRLGDVASVSFSSAGAPSLKARVSYIQPQVDPLTRTLQVRLDAVNPNMRLKPEMFVNVEFASASSPQLTVPAEAVLDTGDRQTVFVNLGNGYLEPRQVTIGDRFGDRIVVTRGLTEGERVVSAGTFLIDSESQLRSAAGAMGAPASPHAGHVAAEPSKPAPERVPTSPRPNDGGPDKAAVPVGAHGGHGDD
jgi:membrane fusion protein, copper/silver efflux system